MVITLKQKGANGYWNLFSEISTFVKENFNLIYEGAERLQHAKVKGVEAIEADYYAPQRVQIGKTRLHAHMGLKYANGFKYNGFGHPQQADLIQAVKDIQRLIDEAARVIHCPLQIQIIKKS